MNPKELEIAITGVVGEMTEQEKEGSGYYDYYDEYAGLNLFYHVLAGTGSHLIAPNDEMPFELSSHSPYTIKLAFGTFERIEKTEKYDESGDLDEELVFKFSYVDGSDPVYYRKYGALDSWEGGVWDGGLEEVKQVEKTIKVWEKI